MTGSPDRDGSVALDIILALESDVLEIAVLLEEARHWLADKGVAQWTRAFTDA